MADFGNLSAWVKNQSNAPNEILNLLDFQIAFFTITIIATVLGNVLVLAAIIVDSRLRTVTNYFVACLAISDVLVACFSVSIRLLTQFVARHHQRDRGILNVHVCRFWNWIDIFCEAASIYTLTVISIDRYFKISRPFQYREKMTKTVAIIIIVAIWAFAALLASLGLVPFGDAKGIVLSDTTCMNINKIFYTIASVVAFFLPLAVLMVMYTLIFRIALYHFKKDNAITMLDPVSGKQLHYSAYKDLKATRTLFIVVFTFVICWGPFFTLFLIHQYQLTTLKKLGHKTSTVLQLVFFNYLPYANSFFNPIIYACFDKIYRRSFRKILLKMIGRSQNLANSKEYNGRSRARSNSVFELTIAQQRESIISFSNRGPAASPDETKCFYHINSRKCHENGSASSPSGILTDLGPDESEVMLFHDGK